ncbi:hypothetical protein KIN20_006579 [Parelaphostrongylus tenuis]|uniref:Uncharacterized protein n=1 Tax=Parelaphostrongylus tenuis TaxID=148309 RepID=A0AAD5QGW8_PARTN|nr:hypothetical protein KIN20_006579 [Parelaphostrongylus tenuis]
MPRELYETVGGLSVCEAKDYKPWGKAPANERRAFSSIEAVSLQKQEKGNGRISPLPGTSPLFHGDLGRGGDRGSESSHFHQGPHKDGRARLPMDANPGWASVPGGGMGKKV